MSSRHYPEDFTRDVVTLARKGEVANNAARGRCGDLRDHAVPVDQLPRH